jgi:hypothetical protein
MGYSLAVSSTTQRHFLAQTPFRHGGFVPDGWDDVSLEKAATGMLVIRGRGHGRFDRGPATHAQAADRASDRVTICWDIET